MQKAREKLLCTPYMLLFSSYVSMDPHVGSISEKKIDALIQIFHARKKDFFQNLFFSD